MKHAAINYLKKHDCKPLKELANKQQPQNLPIKQKPKETEPKLHKQIMLSFY